MHFEDLSKYTYTDVVSDRVVNVGWLEWKVPFPKGKPPPGFVENLDVCLEYAQVNRMRGWHECRLCWGTEVPTHTVERFEVPGTGKPTYATLGDRQVLLGSAEIWVPARGGLICAAPDLVVHYVRVHEYLPPPIFVRAVLDFDPVSWDAEAAFASCTHV